MDHTATHTLRVVTVHIISIKTNYPASDVQSCNLITEMVAELSGGLDVRQSEFDNIDMMAHCVELFVTFPDADGAKMFITQMMDHKSIPHEGFEQIEDWDYRVEVHSPLTDHMQTYLHHREMMMMSERISLLESQLVKAVEIADRADQQSQRMMAMSHASGMLYYREIMESFLKMMETSGIISKNDIQSKMTIPLH